MSSNKDYNRTSKQVEYWMVYMVRIERLTKPIHLFLKLETFLGYAGALNEIWHRGRMAALIAQMQTPARNILLKLEKSFGAIPAISRRYNLTMALCCNDAIGLSALSMKCWRSISLRLKW